MTEGEKKTARHLWETLEKAQNTELDELRKYIVAKIDEFLAIKNEEMAGHLEQVAERYVRSVNVQAEKYVEDLYRKWMAGRESRPCPV